MIKAKGIVNASPAAVHRLFEDNTRVNEYNDFFERGVDLEEVAENTKVGSSFSFTQLIFSEPVLKVVWASASPIFPFKQRDFCTIVHFRELKDGTIVVLNTATEHSQAPVTNKYVRASIILAANIIQPIANDPNKCRLTMLTQLDPGLGYTTVYLP